MMTNRSNPLLKTFTTRLTHAACSDSTIDLDMNHGIVQSPTLGSSSDSKISSGPILAFAFATPSPKEGQAAPTMLGRYRRFGAAGGGEFCNQSSS
jgi:hypothetical protein